MIKLNIQSFKRLIKLNSITNLTVLIAVLLSINPALSNEIITVLDSILVYENGTNHHSGKNIFYYDDQGLLKTEERWNTNSYNGNYWDVMGDSIIYYYDENDSLILKNHHPPLSHNNRIQTQWEYYRNTEGILNSYVYRTWHAVAGHPSYFSAMDSNVYEYYSNSLISALIDYEPDIKPVPVFEMELERKYDYYYNTNNKIYERVLSNFNPYPEPWDDEWTNKYKWQYLYNESNDLIQDIWYKWNYNGTDYEWLNFRKNTYTNYGNNYYEKCSYFWESDNNIWVKNSKLVTFYDTDDNIVKTQTYGWNSSNENWDIWSENYYYYSDVEIIPSVPISNWVFGIGFLFISVFVVVQYRKRLA